MNTPEPSPVPPETREDPGLHPPLFRQGNRLFVATGAALPNDTCIRSGHPAKKMITKTLRNPCNPMTWFGGQARVEIGLSKKHLESYYIALALTGSLLVLGIVFLITGIVSKSIGVSAFGLLGMLGSGIFRAAVPIRTPNSKAEPLEIRGADGKYLQNIPEWSGDVPNR